MANALEKAISILAGNLNTGRSYLITAVTYLEADNVGDRPHHHSCTMLLELVVM